MNASSVSCVFVQYKSNQMECIAPRSRTIKLLELATFVEIRKQRKLDEIIESKRSQPHGSKPITCRGLNLRHSVRLRNKSFYSSESSNCIQFRFNRNLVI